MQTATQTAPFKSFQDLVLEAKTEITELDTATLHQWRAEKHPVLLIDVREPDEFNKGSIGGALNIPRGLLEISIVQAAAEAVQANKPIVVYCAGGGRSALAARSLGQMGYQQVYSLAGGFKAWMES